MRPCADVHRGALGAALVLLAGCAFDDGQPWGRADLVIEVEMPIAEDRRVDDALATSNDYLLRLDRVRLRADAVTLRLASVEGSGVFDPADPPEGYSLCHNGHCHAADGRLVDYADIELELSGGAGGGPETVATVEDGVELTPGGSALRLPLGPCSDACRLPRGTLAGLEVLVTSVLIEGEARDRRTGDAARLGDPRPFSLRVEVTAPIRAPISGRVGRDQPVGVDIVGRLSLPPTLFDGLDWSAPEAALIAGLQTNLTAVPTLSVTVGRAR